MEKTLFSTPELAEWVGVFHTTIRRWIERGQIKGIRVGRNYKIPGEEVVRILEDHGISLPEVVRRYKLKAKNNRQEVFAHGDNHGSILRQLLVVEELEDPAFVCRHSSILGANRTFADLVGYNPADLIGANIAEVIEEPVGNELFDFIQGRRKRPEKGPKVHAARLKTTTKNGRKKIKITAGPLGHLEDVFLLVIKDVRETVNS